MPANKKRIFSIAVAVLFVTFAFIRYSADHQEASGQVREVNVETDSIVFHNLKELEDFSQLIIVATPTKKFNDRSQKSTTFPDGTLQDFASFNELKIAKVIKAPSDFDQTKTWIEVAEPVAIVKEGNSSAKLKKQGYTEMKKDSQYIIYLSKNAMGQYSVNGITGRYNLDGTDTDDTDAKIDEGHKSQLREEVEAKYPELIKSKMK